MDNIFVEFLPPWIETNMQPAFYDKESGTCLQQTARMYDRVNMLVRMFNKLSKETRESFTELYNYVHDFFDNLDVQEEVNNKLNEMVENGELAEILNEQIFADLNVSDNFVILNSKITDSVRGIVYYKTILRPAYGKTTYVPLKGKTSENTLAQTADHPINMFDFSTKINSVFISNSDSVGSFAHTAIVRDSEILNEGGETSGNVIGINNEGDIKIYDGTITGTELIEDKIVNSWGCASIIVNGETSINDSDPDVADNKHPRTVIVQCYDSKDIIFLHIEGRNAQSVGLTFAEVADLVIETIPNVKYAGCFGGGGDSQLMISGRMINDCNDNQLRPLYDVIYLDPNTVSFDNVVSSEIGNARMSETTLHDFLKSRVNLTNSYRYAKAILTAELISENEYKNRFVCNLDYNTVLEVGDTVIITFPDVSNNPNANLSGLAGLNIHYALEISQPTIKNQYGSDASVMEISNKTLLLKWDGTNYNIIESSPAVGLLNDVDIDDIKEKASIYSNSFTNKPTILGSSVGAGLLVCTPLPVAGYAYQYYFERPTNRVFVRSLENNVWNDWTKLSDNVRENIGGKNLNTEVVDKFYRGYGNSLVNKPENTSNGWCINLPGLYDGYNAQIFIERQTGADDGRIFLRLEENGVWSNWKQIAFVS